MTEITLKIEAPELAHAILKLAGILAMYVSTEAGKFDLSHRAPSTQASGAQLDITVTQPPQGIPVAPTAADVAPQAPTVPPIQPPGAAPTGVPTTAPTYTADQLAVAATQLVDAGRRVELVGLLQSFGVQALTTLPREQYGAFATALRGMGARL